MSKNPDIEISDELAVRPCSKKFIQIRVGDEGWHREAANLTKTQAKELANLLLKFAEEK
jgi:hypothetical protein